MLWLIPVIFIFLIGAGATLYALFSKVRERQDIMRKNVTTAQGEVKAKEEVLQELSTLILGYGRQEDFDQFREQMTAKEEALRAEKGRLTITEAELEAVETRLRELEELERELETSSLEAAQELEMLRSQERSIREDNERLKKELDSAMFQLDLLLNDLASSAETVAQLNAVKTELMETQAKCEFYNEQVAMLNEKYMQLKRAYDALDIEYAQLYEKQNEI